jgi:hypothetical protein
MEQFEKQPATVTSNRICSPISICDENAIELMPASSTNDRQCACIRGEPVYFCYSSFKKRLDVGSCGT